MIMRFSVLLSILILSACGGREVTSSSPTQDDIVAARGAAKQLGGELKTELMTAMKEGGPTAAINVCAEQAPHIADKVSKETGYTVGRTALRVRNQANAPHVWEKAQLETFAAELADGGNPALMETAVLYTKDGQAEFRWAKPIVLEGPCAMCHGENVSPEIKALIMARYPDDEATGFAPGELRGMFTVTKAIN